MAILSKNKCAFPGCDHPLLNLQGVYVAELCHIHAAEPGGQRYNQEQTDEERRAPENLLFLCHQHHKETDDEVRYPAKRLREIKNAHEALPAVIFNSDLLLHRIEEVIAEQTAIRKMLGSAPSQSSSETYSIVGPELQDSWTPEVGRFYETLTGPQTKFKYMMRDGWLHVEQQLEDGAIAYYEINEEGSVRNSRMPYPINEYCVIIPDDLVLRRETIHSDVGTHAIRTTLKWSKGTVTEHFVGNQLAGVDCGARCHIYQKTRTIIVL
ncbi:HNH endonuclease [Ampullimonas aquatilis]|uniref:HNH endonuclease n=1 Tax=Ampullimonas aquatilis TaxID=1341549 RepID=UPI003C737B4F